MYCIFCNSEIPFVRFGVPSRSRAKCSRCGSLERHRLIWKWLSNFKMDLLRRACLIHISAEIHLRAVLSKAAMQYSAPRWDLRNIPASDASFDIILHNHVMEHIFEDRDAFRQQARVLKPGGELIFTVPIQGEFTRESLDGNETPKMRLQKFGQADHWRIYGSADLIGRLHECGFEEAEIIDAKTCFGERAVEQERLDRFLVRATIGNMG